MLGSQNEICNFQSSVKAKLSTHCIYSCDEEFQPKKMCVKWKQDDTETGAAALLEDNDFLCDVPFISLSFSCTTSAEKLNWTRTISFQYDHGHRESHLHLYAANMHLMWSSLDRDYKIHHAIQISIPFWKHIIKYHACAWEKCPW